MVSKIFHSSRDDVVGTVTIQGKEVGYIKSVAPAIDNDSQELQTIDSRTVLKFTGAEKISMKLDSRHYIMIEPNLFELAMGHKAVDADGNILLAFEDDMTIKWNTAQYSSDAIGKVWNGLNYPIAEEHSLCQSFVARGTNLLGQKFFCGKEGAYADTLNLTLHPDDGTGKPDTTVTLLSGSFSVTDINTWIVSEYKWRAPGNPLLYSSLVVGTTYWIKFTQKGNTGSAANYFGLKYYSASNNFPDGKLLKKDDAVYTDLNYDSAFELLFENKYGVEIVIRLTNGTNKITKTFKNCKVSAVDCSVESNALIFDSGTIEAEEMIVEEGPL